MNVTHKIIACSSESVLEQFSILVSYPGKVPGEKWPTRKLFFALEQSAVFLLNKFESPLMIYFDHNLDHIIKKGLYGRIVKDKDLKRCLLKILNELPGKISAPNKGIKLTINIDRSDIYYQYSGYYTDDHGTNRIFCAGFFDERQ
jgi:hypothetical protein